MMPRQGPLRVLLVNTPHSLNYRGGDLTQLRKTGDALRRLGVEVGESFESSPDAGGYDLAHIFNLRTLDVTSGQVRALKQQGKPVVLSPIYLNPGLALWANRIARNIFGSPRDPGELERLLDGFRTYKLKVTTGNGTHLAADTPNRAADYDSRQVAILKDVDYLLPNSFLEMNSLVRTLRVIPPPFSVVPYAADAGTYLDPDPEPFVKKFGLKDFILQVGRIEASKNQLMMVFALRDAGLPVVLIGQSMQPDYLAMCKRYGPRDLTIIPHLPTEELRHAYAAARVHVLPSWVETCGLVSMEAALADCNLVMSTAGYELEYYRDMAYYCDPSDVASIRSAVLSAFQNYDRDAKRRDRLKQFIQQTYTWDNAAKISFEAYERTMDGDNTPPSNA